MSEIQVRLYKAALLTGVLVSVACMLGNLLVGFPLSINLKWVLLLLLCSISLFYANNWKQRGRWMFTLFCFLVFVFLPFAFFDSGGSNNNAIGYIFLVLIGTTYLFEGWRRIFLVTGLILMFMLLHTLEHFYPQLVMVYPSTRQFWDRLFQIPMLLAISFFIILRFGKEYKRVNGKLHEMANLDVLTGLYNRRKFNTAIEEALTGQHGSAWLVLLDLDNFKKVNDLCGHAAGDAVLQQLAHFLLSSLGSGQNTVSRWGGDEFAVIYYGDAALLGQKLAAMKADFAAYVAQYNPSTDISYSIAPVDSTMKADDLLVLVDHLLYAEKLHKCSQDGLSNQL